MEQKMTAYEKLAAELEDLVNLETWLMGSAHPTYTEAAAAIRELVRRDRLWDERALLDATAIAMWKDSAEKAEAERDRLRAALDAVQQVATKLKDPHYVTMAGSLDMHEGVRAVLELVADELAVALATGGAPMTRTICPDCDCLLPHHDLNCRSLNS